MHWLNNSTEASDARRVRDINAWTRSVRTLENAFSDRTLEQLSEQLASLRNEANKNTYDERFRIAAAVIASAISKVRHFRLHDVQVAGAAASASGSIIEMQTGEGKTIVCAMSALLRSVFDTSVHVATTSDYLAERDFGENKELFERLKTSAGLLELGAKDAQTRANYRCRITYGPGYLFGFDYLRDQVKIRRAEQLVLGRSVLDSIHGRSIESELSQVDHQSIIVDEADSVLLDEASTPLILSEPQKNFNPDSLEAFQVACELEKQLQEGQDFVIDRVQRRARLTSQGERSIYENISGQNRIPLERPWTVYVENAIFAQHLLLRDEHYVVDGEEVKLVDQFTGRILDDRQLRGGLHQAVEAKEALPLRPANQTTSRLTRQTFFGLYDRVCGMTGTISGNEPEIEYFFDSKVSVFQPNLPSKRKSLPTRTFATIDAKLAALAEDLVQRSATGQPILVGTRTIRDSLQVSNALKHRRLEHVVLNGIQDQSEAEIVASAGQVGAVTIATNMAGRGTDIKLSQASRDLGGLHVACTQHNTSQRVDRQLVGRCARQGDPGTYQYWISAEDDLFQRFSPGLAARIRKAACKDGEVRKDFAGNILQLQSQLEAEQYQQRRSLVKQDHWMDQVRLNLVQST